MACPGIISCKISQYSKNSIGGYVLTHLHIIPWKFSIEFNENHFKKLYSQWLNNIFDLISKNQLENIAYPYLTELYVFLILQRNTLFQHIISILIKYLSYIMDWIII